MRYIGKIVCVAAILVSGLAYERTRIDEEDVAKSLEKTGISTKGVSIDRVYRAARKEQGLGFTSSDEIIKRIAGRDKVISDNDLANLALKNIGSIKKDPCIFPIR